MKKFLRIMPIVAIVTTAIVYITTSITKDEENLHSSEQVILTPSEETNEESKEFTLNTYDDNGVTVYGFDVEDQEYREAALDYIKKLTGDPGNNR